MKVPNVGKETRATCRRSKKSRAWASTAGSHAAAAITGNPKKTRCRGRAYAAGAPAAGSPICIAAPRVLHVLLYVDYGPTGL